MEYTSAETNTGLTLCFNKRDTKHEKCFCYSIRPCRCYLLCTLIVFNTFTIGFLYNYIPSKHLPYIPDLTPISGYTQSGINTLESFFANWTLPKCYRPDLSDSLSTSDPNCPTEEVKNDPVFNGKPFPDHFKFHIEPKCSDYDYKYLVVYFYSRAYNFKQRRMIRLKLMDYLGDIIGYKVKVMFIIGTLQGVQHIVGGEEAIRKEAETFQDILRPYIPESTDNLALKGLAGFQWLIKCSGHTPFILKMDDDFLLNMTAIYILLPNIPCAYSNSLMCYDVKPHILVKRFPGHSQVLKADYSPGHYPLSCVGHGYIMTRQVLSRLYDAAKRLDKISIIDDMYFSALLRRRACIDVSEIDLEKGVVSRKRFAD